MTRMTPVLMTQAKKLFGNANRLMDEMTIAMTEIDQASEQARKSVRTIDKIAFQTNLLVLNAAGGWGGRQGVNQKQEQPI